MRRVLCPSKDLEASSGANYMYDCMIDEYTFKERYKALLVDVYFCPDTKPYTEPYCGVANSIYVFFSGRKVDDK